MIIGKRRIVIVAAFFGALCRAGAAFATSEPLPAYPEQPLLGPQAAKAVSSTAS